MNFAKLKIQSVFNLRNAIMVPDTAAAEPVHRDSVAALYLELFSLGFRLNADAYAGIQRMTASNFNDTSKIILDEIYTRLGMHVRYNVLYKGFPKCVPDFDTYNFLRFCSVLHLEFGVADDVEKLACGHAVDGNLLSAETFGACPVCQMSTDTRLIEDGGAIFKNMNNRLQYLKSRKTKLLDVGAATEQTFDVMVSNVMASKSSISPEDQQLLTVAFANFSKTKLGALLPQEFCFKEVLAQCVFEYANRFTRHDTVDAFGAHITTAKDVLRIAKEFRDRPLKKVDADYTVEDGVTNKDGVKTRVKYKMTNDQRKLIANLLDRITNPEEDMIRDRMDWVHLNKAVHFGQFKSKFPNAFAATDRLFNRPETIQTYEAVYEALLVGTDTAKLVKHLKQRPGFFARTLHSVLRKHEDKAHTVLNAFEKVGSDASMRVLVSLHDLYKSELNDFHDRVYVDSETNKTKMIETPRVPLLEKTNRKASEVVDRAINAKLKFDNGLSQVLIDPVLKQYKLPMKMRDVAESKEKRARGSVVTVEPGATVRTFIYWHENEAVDCVDLDLSVTLYDETLTNIVEESSFYDMNQKGYSMTHSGDIQSAPNGASEIVDIDLQKALTNGARYALMFVNSYSGAAFSSFEAFAGVQTGDNLGAKVKINPLNVETRFDLSGSARAVVAVLIDLKENQIIHGNLASDHMVCGTNYDARNTNTIIGQFLINEAKCNMSMYDYLERFAKANGAEVVNTAQPDVGYDYVFDYTTSQNIDEFNAKWLQ